LIQTILHHTKHCDAHTLHSFYCHELFCERSYQQKKYQQPEDHDRDDSVGENDDTDEMDYKDNEKDFSNSKKRKRHRGCRGGKRAKQRILQQSTGNGGAFTVANPNDPVSAIQTVIDEPSKLPSFVSNFTDKDNQSLVPFITKVVKNICRNSELDHKYDMVTQETFFDSSLDISKESIQTHSQLSRSQKARKRLKWKKLLHRKTVKTPIDYDLENDSMMQLHFPSTNQLLSSQSMEIMESDCGRYHHLHRQHLVYDKQQDTKSKLNRDKHKKQQIHPQSAEENFEIWEYSIPRSSVSNYIKAILRNILPWKVVWGSRHNLKIIMKKIDSFTELSRHENISLSNILQGFRLRDVPWLRKSVIARVGVIAISGSAKQDEFSFENDEGGGATQSTLVDELDFQAETAHRNFQALDEDRLDQTLVDEEEDEVYCHQHGEQYTQQHTMFRKFVLWVFNRLVIPAFANAFYITEAEGHGSNLFYYHKHVWKKIIQSHIHEFQDNFLMVSILLCKSSFLDLSYKAMYVY
jgi:hypothetical protein